MGYFDALASSSFKTTEDGRRLFFPWGVLGPWPWGTLGRGYAIPSEEEFVRLHRRVKSFMVVSLPLIITAVIWKGFSSGLAILAFLMIPYAFWAQMQSRRLDRTDEKLTLGESLASQARAHSGVGLWLLEVGALAFVAIGVFMLLLDSENWHLALGSIAFFGLCAVVFARMLITKRREARS